MPRVEAFTPCSEGCPVEVQQLENQRDTRAVGLSVLSDSWKKLFFFIVDLDMYNHYDCENFPKILK